VSARQHGALVDALDVLHARLAAVRLGLDAPSADDGRRERVEVLDQLDDYLLPRLRSAGSPLLVVVGGSTGAGKSTLVNSLLGELVTSAGVLRPTTRWPVLVHHPLDARWFTTDRVLPGLARLSDHRQVPAGQPDAGQSASSAGLRLVASSTLPVGLAILDAPDIDSVVEENRTLATQLLGAADAWLFVTTAARYADAVPWELLAAAARRRVHLALVLDRVDDDDADVVGAHLRAMLDDRGLADAAILHVPEVALVDGLLPERAIGAVADWLTALGMDPAARAEAIRATRDGVLQDVLRRALFVAAAADRQRDADRRLRSAARAAYSAAGDDVRRATSDSTLLRGEVLARWQDVVGTGDLARLVEERVSWLRDRVVAAFRGRRAPEPALATAIGHGLEAVVLDAAEDAAERTHAAWRGDTAGAGLLDGLALSRASADLRGRVAEQIRAWQSDVLGLVEQEGAAKRTAARAVSFGVNGLGAAAMVAVFASTGGLTGAEIGVAGGSAVLAQRLLEAVFGDEAVRQLTRRAHEQLTERVRVVLEGESARFTAQLDALGSDIADGDEVRAAVVVAQHEHEASLREREVPGPDGAVAPVPSTAGAAGVASGGPGPRSAREVTGLRGAGLGIPAGRVRGSAGSAGELGAGERADAGRGSDRGEPRASGRTGRGLRTWWHRVTRSAGGGDA